MEEGPSVKRNINLPMYVGPSKSPRHHQYQQHRHRQRRPPQLCGTPKNLRVAGSE